MIINLERILNIAEENGWAIAAFNTPTFENLAAAINMAEYFKVPIIIQHAQVHEAVMPLATIGPAMVALAEKASVPICVHIDHGETLDHIKKGLELGFSSVMYDGSSLPYEENVKNTQEAVRLAKKYNASVEAEIGTMGGEEGNNQTVKSIYTDPVLAKEFVNETKIDALAASFGTVHGFYKAKPNLDYERIEKIKDNTGIPLVMHGGSGLSESEYKQSIEKGVRKINYYSYSSKAALDAVEDEIQKKQMTLFHEVSQVAQKAIEEDYKKVLQIFYNLK